MSRLWADNPNLPPPDKAFSGNSYKPERDFVRIQAHRAERASRMTLSTLIANHDYAKMDAPDMLQALGDDAAKWAAAFRQTALRLGYSDMDEGWLIGWFANAIEHSTDVRRWRRETTSTGLSDTDEEEAR